MRGIVKWFSTQKGFGFITCPEGDAFVHYSNIEGDGHKSLNEGDDVDFSIVDSNKGLKAENVTVIKKAPVMNESQIERE